MSKNTITEMLAKSTGLEPTEVANVLENLGTEELGMVQGGVCVDYGASSKLNNKIKIRSIICA